jgi:hypothetical protein
MGSEFVIKNGRIPQGFREEKIMSITVKIVIIGFVISM